MDALLESIALRDAAALENAFYDLKGPAPPSTSTPPAIVAIRTQPNP